MEKNELGQASYSDNEKNSLGPPNSTSSSQTSYPPSPGYVSDEPSWARHSGTSLRQRVFGIFGSTVSTSNSQGYVPVDNPSSHSEEAHLPFHAQLRSQNFDELKQNPAHKKLFKILCLALLFSGLFAFSGSFSSSGDARAKAQASDLELKSDSDLSMHSSTLSAPLFTDAELDDRQCPPILEKGADAIACRVELAQRKFDSMLSRQAQTFEQAVAQYIQQYNRSPPPGFDQWFAFAKENHAVIIDDYGQLEKDLEPLRRISGPVLRQRMKDARKADFWGLHQWDFTNGTVTTSAKWDWEPVWTFREIMSPFLHKLPEFSILHNWDDNHRVCGPKNGEEDANSTSVSTALVGGPDANPIKHLTQGCPRNTGTSSLVSSDRPSIDLCSNADEWKNRHGIFGMGNGCFTSTIPVLSLAKVTSFQDVMTASWCYGSFNYRLFGGKKDTVAYADKKSHLYWRGSNTGSPSDEKHGYNGHRQHLVMLAHQAKAKATELAERIRASNSTTLAFNDEDRKRVTLPNMPETFTEAQLSAISRLKGEAFDINFVNLHGCEDHPAFCEGWKKQMPLSERQHQSTAFQNKFLMDLDGNSMSCRFYRLLDSNSLVFKQTIYAEWHDDRIVPWLHYIPVSTDLEELPVLVDFFANDPRGQKLGQKIANASREWAATGLRKVDLSIYTYRQLLELAHIIGHD